MISRTGARRPLPLWSQKSFDALFAGLSIHSRRNIVTRSSCANLTTRQTALALGMTEALVKIRLLRARLKMRWALSFMMHKHEGTIRDGRLRAILRRAMLALWTVSLLLPITSIAATSGPKDALQKMAAEIEHLKREFPQLEQFSATLNTDRARLVIQYAFHTHRAERRGGWTAGVPNPDDDGTWFYIDLHDAASTAQIDTQPSMLPMCFGRMRATFLILEGERTKPLAERLGTILRCQIMRKEQVGLTQVCGDLSNRTGRIEI